MEMWEKINQEEGRAERLLSEGMKHGNQQTNIVERMVDGGLMTNTSGEVANSDVIYVEYGAGKAGLSSFVAAKLADLHEEAPFEKSRISFLVVDRECRRFKKDGKVKHAGFETDR